MPTAMPDTAVTAPDTPVTLSVLDNDDGAGLTITALDSPTAGSVVANGDGTVTYTPNAGFIGIDSFTYTVSDSVGATASAVITITVAVPNRPPAAQDDTVTVAPGTAITIDAIANDNDPDGDPLRFAALELPPHGDLSVSEGKLHYRPEQGFTGPDSFAYTVTDDRGGLATAIVRIAVSAVDQPPVAAADSVETTLGTPVAIDVLANDQDPEGQALTLTALDLPLHGTLAVGPGQRLALHAGRGLRGGRPVRLHGGGSGRSHRDQHGDGSGQGSRCPTPGGERRRHDRGQHGRRHRSLGQRQRSRRRAADAPGPDPAGQRAGRGRQRPEDHLHARHRLHRHGQLHLHGGGQPRPGDERRRHRDA